MNSNTLNKHTWEAQEVMIHAAVNGHVPWTDDLRLWILIMNAYLWPSVQAASNSKQVVLDTTSL